MHPNFAALSARRSAGTLSALLGLLLLVAGLLPGCANPHETPQTLFAHIQELNARGKFRAIWDLYTDDERKRQSKGFDDYRAFLRRNPGEKNRAACVRTYGLEPAELMGLSHVDMFEIVSSGNETVMMDARITDDDAAPDLANGHRVYWVTAQGRDVAMLVQYVNDGWYLVTLKE